MNELMEQQKGYLTQQAKSCLKRMTSDIIELSQIAHEYHQAFGYQEYIGWISELGLSKRTGVNFLNVHEKFGSANFALNDIQPSILYLLSEPNVPESARQEAIEKAESGEKLSVKDTKELIDAFAPVKPMTRNEKPSRVISYMGISLFWELT